MWPARRPEDPGGNADVPKAAESAPGQRLGAVQLPPGYAGTAFVPPPGAPHPAVTPVVHGAPIPPGYPQMPPAAWWPGMAPPVPHGAMPPPHVSGVSPHSPWPAYPVPTTPIPVASPVAASDVSDSVDSGPKQLIVNYLDPAVTNADLHDAFSVIGPVTAARVIYDNTTAVSKQFGFVYFKHSTDAARAMECMSGHPIRGRRIKVSYANPQRPLPSGTPPSTSPQPSLQVQHAPSAPP